MDVETGDGDGNEAHGSEDAEAAAHVVFDDEGLVALVGGELAQGSAVGVGDGDDALGGGVAAYGLLKLFAQDAESDGRLGGSAGLGDDNDAELLAFEVFLQVVEIILADVVTGEENLGGADATVLERAESVGEGFDDGLGAEVAAADADADDGLALVAQSVGGLLDFVEEGVGCAGGQVGPAQEVVAEAGAFVDGLECCLSLREDGGQLCGGYKLLDIVCVYGE